MIPATPANKLSTVTNAFVVGCPHLQMLLKVCPIIRRVRLIIIIIIIVKSNKELKSAWGILRRQIVPKIGQLTNDPHIISLIVRL
jgi:hypothetical protein